MNESSEKFFFEKFRRYIFLMEPRKEPWRKFEMISKEIPEPWNPGRNLEGNTRGSPKKFLKKLGEISGRNPRTFWRNSERFLAESLKEIQSNSRWSSKGIPIVTTVEFSGELRRNFRWAQKDLTAKILKEIVKEFRSNFWRNFEWIPGETLKKFRKFRRNSGGSLEEFLKQISRLNPGANARRNSMKKKFLDQISGGIPGENL